jgi:hypothetical protein
VEELRTGGFLVKDATQSDVFLVLTPEGKVPAEQEGAYNLFKGAIQFFKNPSSHRKVNYENRNVAIETIVLAELLPGILSTSQKRP